MYLECIQAGIFRDEEIEVFNMRCQTRREDGAHFFRTSEANVDSKRLFECSESQESFANLLLSF